MRSVTRFATLLFATAALAACDDKADFSNVLLPNITSIAGTWNLHTINGALLPVGNITLVNGGNAVTVNASTLTLVATNSTSGTFTLSFTINGANPGNTTGTYTLNGTALSLVLDVNGNPLTLATPIAGSFNGGNTLSLTVNNNTLGYIR